jgi:hypothetical protein
MAELADALALEVSGRKVVWVRVPLWAPNKRIGLEVATLQRHALVAKLVDAPLREGDGRKAVWVRVPPWAPKCDIVFLVSCECGGS